MVFRFEQIRKATGETKVHETIVTTKEMGGVLLKKVSGHEYQSLF